MRQQTKAERRSSERFLMPSNICLETILNDVDVKLPIEDLSPGGALLLSPDLSESLQTGQTFDGCTLQFPGGPVRVKATVRWQLWPRVGVEFSTMNSRDLTKLLKFLDSIAVKVR